MKETEAAAAPFAAQREEKDDSVGNITVVIHRRKGKNYVKGSLIRSFTVKSTRVSEVAAIVEHALFGSAKPERSSRTTSE